MAEYSDKKIEQLEVNRKRLYEEYPPSPEFQKWSRHSKDKRNKQQPPDN